MGIVDSVIYIIRWESREEDPVQYVWEETSRQIVILRLEVELHYRWGRLLVLTCKAKWNEECLKNELEINHTIY